MKRLIALLVLPSLLIWFGCGDDDDPPNGPTDTTPTITVTAAATGPDFSSVDEAVWSGVPATTLAVSTTNSPKIGTPKTAIVANSIIIQAIKTADSLFFRFRWSDATFSVWKDHWATISISPPINFVHNEAGFDEDHLYLMFDDGSEGWDVWHWAVLSTGAGSLAEGMTYVGGQLASDNGDLNLAFSNIISGFTVPAYVHADGAAFTGWYLVQDLDSLTEYYTNTTGWTMGQKVPGYIIDISMKDDTNQDARRKSRYDIRSVSEWDETGEEYTLVLGRALNTGYTEDIDLTDVTTIKAKVGLFDDQDIFSTGGTGRGFTVEFNLVIQ